MNIKYQAALLTVALALGSCATDAMFDDGTGSGSKGSVSKPGVEVSNAENVIKDGSRASYDINPFILDFYRAGEADPFMSSAYGDLKATVDLPAGDYTISVRSHNVQKAEWDRPYFTGSSEQFTIESEKITTVKPIKCVFSSIKVSVVFGPKLREVMGDNLEVTVVANDAGKLVYTPTETRAGYFEAVEGSSTMAVTFKGTVNGFAEEITQTFANIEKGQHRIITFETGGNLPQPDVPSGTLNVGGITIDFDYTDESLDGSVNPGNEDVINDGEDEPGKLPNIDDDDPNVPVDPDDPKESNLSFSGTLQNGGTYTSTQLADYTVVVDAKEPITAFDVRIVSTSLTPDELAGAGLSDEFSLSEPGEFADALIGLGFPCGDGSLERENAETGAMEPVPAVMNATHVEVSVTSFMPLLEILGESTSTFYMTVTSGGETKTISFTIVVE